MVKCLIRIRTKVNVHLRMINHCYRDVKVRVLNLGPRLLGRALGALPLFPALTGVLGREPGLSGEVLSGMAPSTAESTRETGVSNEVVPGLAPSKAEGIRETGVPDLPTATSESLALPVWTKGIAERITQMGVSGEASAVIAPTPEESSEKIEKSDEVLTGLTLVTKEIEKGMGEPSEVVIECAPDSDQSNMNIEEPDKDLIGWAPATVADSGKKRQQDTVRYLQGLESLRDSAHSTPVRSSDHINALSPGVSRETVISDEAYTPCCSILPTPVCDPTLETAFGQQVNGAPCTTQEEEGDVSVHSVPDTEVPPPALPGPEGVSQRESESEQGNKFLQSVLRLLAVTFCLLLALLLLLVILAESDLELAFLRDIRLTPEFQQFHYQYFCPLRRWVSCKLHPIIRLIDS